MSITRTICIVFLAFTFTSAIHLRSVRGDVTFDGFDDTSSLQLNGAAATAVTSDGTVLRITPAVGNQAGSFFSFNKVSTAEFTSVFSFRITNSGGPVFDFNNEPGADGLVFVVQNLANTVGTAGQGIGYQFIGSSIGVEFDTWGNAGNNDPSQSHVGIDVNGSVTHGLPGMGPTKNIGNTNAPTDLPGPELDDGVRWWSWVRYDGSVLDVFLLQSESTTPPGIPAAPLLSFPLDLSTILGGSSEAFAGFTSGTGADFADHDITYWRYTESAIPEPSSLVMLVLGVIAASFRRTR
jgi:legume-like lectin family protein/PEP-CTERM motif-containing protein